MRFAAAAGNFCACDSQAAIDFFDDVFFGDWLVKAGPACARIEFGGGVEQGGVTADAAEDAFCVVVGIFVGVRTLGAFAAGDFVGIARKLFAPVGVGFDDLSDGGFF